MTTKIRIFTVAACEIITSQGYLSPLVADPNARRHAGDRQPDSLCDLC